MMSICNKEIKSYFLSPIAYVLIGFFLVLSGYFFCGTTIGSGIATMEYTFVYMIIIFLVICPILTMRLISEEKKAGTEQLLFTSPLKLWDIVLGKYLAAMSVYIVILLITFIYPLILYYYSKIDLGPVLTGYIGIFLVGAAFISVGLFASSLTENQIIAGIVSFAILAIFASLEILVGVFSGAAGQVFEFLSILNRFFSNFQVGIIDASDIAYFISFIFIFLFLTIRVIEKRRWSKG